MGVTPAAFAAVQFANLNNARPVGVGVGVGVIFFATFLVKTTATAELLQDFTFVVRKAASIGSTDN
jgi:hypothetical protein